MKRIIWILITALLLLTGCDNRQQVVVCFRDCDDPLTQAYRQDLEQALTDAGYGVTVLDAGKDQSKQDRQVAQLIEDKVDLLILEPVMVTALEEIALQTQEAELPVVLVNREPDGETLEKWNRACYVGCDAEQPGFLQGQLVTGLPDMGDLNGDGILSYAVIAGPEDHLDAQLRSDACARALEERGIQAERLALEYGEWTREDAQRRCEKLLATYGKDIEVIFCNSDEMAIGAMEAIRDGGRTVGKNVYLYGIGGDLQSRLLIRSGDLTGTVTTDIPAQVRNVLVAMRILLAEDTLEKENYVNHIAIDQTNVEEYIEE